MPTGVQAYRLCRLFTETIIARKSGSVLINRSPYRTSRNAIYAIYNFDRFLLQMEIIARGA